MRTIRISNATRKHNMNTKFREKLIFVAIVFFFLIFENRRNRETEDTLNRRVYTINSYLI